MIRPISFLVLAAAFLTAPRAQAQVPKNNPLVDAAMTIGAKGLGSDALKEKAGWPFKPAGGRIYVKAYVASLGVEPAQRDALEEGILAILERYEKAADALKQPKDAETALAFSISVLQSAAKGAALDDAAFTALAPRFRAVLAKTTATDRQKQEFYEYTLSASGMVVALMAATTDEGARKKLQTLAETQLLALIGSNSDAITLNGSSVAIKANALPARTDTEKETPAATGGTAPGLSFAFPQGTQTSGVWKVIEERDGSISHAANIRLVPAVPAQGSFSDAIRAAWKKYVPEELQGRVSGMVFRRYVGDGLVGQFVCGTGPEKGKKWDALYTVYMIDCGKTWQPIVVAQTWNDTSSAFPFYSPWTISGSFGHSAPLVEAFLKTLACPAAKDRPLIDKAAVAGNYSFGTASSLQYENVYTGATAMSTVSYGGSLNLLPTGKFSENYSSASGFVGALRFGGFKAQGNWTLQRDILTLTDTMYDQGDGYKRKLKQYRVAGVVVFANGEKVLVLKDKLNEVVNPLTVSDRSEYYSTAKKKE